MNSIFLGVFFILGTYFDLKYKGLPKWFLAGGFLLSLILCGIFKPVSLVEMLSGMAVGGALLLISLLTKGALGLGDGLFLVVVGIHLGVGAVITVLAFGLLISAIFSLVLLVFRKVSRKSSVPFVPFLTVAYVITFLGQEGYIW